MLESYEGEHTNFKYQRRLKNWDIYKVQDFNDCQLYQGDTKCQNNVLDLNSSQVVSKFQTKVSKVVCQRFRSFYVKGGAIDNDNRLNWQLLEKYTLT